VFYVFIFFLFFFFNFRCTSVFFCLSCTLFTILIINKQINGDYKTLVLMITKFRGSSSPTAAILCLSRGEKGFYVTDTLTKFSWLRSGCRRLKLLSYGSLAVGRVSSCICDCVCVSVCTCRLSKRKTARAINTESSTDAVHRSRQLCYENEVKTSKVKVT